MTDCAICLEQTQLKQNGRYTYGPKGNDAVVLHCTHVFHKACIKKWYTESLMGNTCPCCRADIRPHNMSGLWIRLALLFRYFNRVCNDVCLEDDELHDGYIYYDNASVLLFVSDVCAYMTHFCAYYLKCFKEMKLLLFNNARD
jgi:hypothetical protein